MICTCGCQMKWAGKAARQFLLNWNGKLVCDDYSSYKASFQHGITETGYMAHARRKFQDLYVTNQSSIAENALQTIGLLYDIEREVAETSNEARQQLRQEKAKPVLDKLRHWLISQRQQVTNGTGTAKAID